jgi:hypothetical protein
MNEQAKFTATVINPASANDEGTPAGVNIDNFYALMNKDKCSYIFIPCRDFWPAKSVNARIPPQPVLDLRGQPRRDANGNIIYQKASAWLDKNRSVEAVTWAPGYPLQIDNRLISAGGWIEREGVSCFNLYRPPRIKLGDASKAKFWCDHLLRIYPDDADYITAWCAHRVQHAGDKVNHALVLGGNQGIGKDTLLEAVKRAVGNSNFQEITPIDLFAPFNPYARAVVLRINEAHDLGETDRFKFYQRAKHYITAPPEVLRVNEKNIPEHYVPNVCGVVITTNHKTDGLYLPFDDRRHYVVWSKCKKEDFDPAYWNNFWDNYQNGGFEHVAAYLNEFDLSGFDAKSPPPKTQVFWEITNVGIPTEDAELEDLIDSLGKPDPNNPDIKFPPDVVTISDLIMAAKDDSMYQWLTNRGNRRSLPYRLERCGYTVVPNHNTENKLWRCKNSRQAIYARTDLSTNERLGAAEKKARS